MSDDEVISYFINECGTTYEKASLALEAARALRPIRDDMYRDGVSIYIGIPILPEQVSLLLFCYQRHKAGGGSYA